MNLYVYFKFVVGDHPLVLRCIGDMQDQLALEFPGLVCELLKRPLPDQDGKETWMEVYHGVAADSVDFIERLSQLALKNALPQPRRNEVFIPIE
ncbi:DUF4936 family protein [Polynucleobacter sp. AP-Latsch-80-C2]|jgi:hypothetical protein|uniref:DUF4936 family protein n=1 Tax=Polynucleobacter sp. AP-Latsch-80-C2 TaxID=2576931 RepID=UPI001C0D3947|nr:DUF4936 family protein [Polynucleobacter sp. AP-Latsch-80-C2]MBU3622378.1 DUF4936 family protein [Polynucleobacter sp. AP-Latsch-80-C2]